LRSVGVLLVLLELVVIGWIAWRGVRAVRSARRGGSGDPLDRLRCAAVEFLPSPRVASILASEIAVFYYGLAAWRARPHVPAGSSAFTHHERSGHAGIVLGLLIMVAAEGFGVHVLLLHWSVPAAWILTALSAYAALWLIADYRATVLRPILVGEERVSLRAGLRWSLEVARSEILEVTRTLPESERNRLKLTLLGAPTHWIVFSCPQVAEGLYGLRRHVRAVGIEPDAAAEFGHALTAMGS
jgi:hypothetical protein